MSCRNCKKNKLQKIIKIGKQCISSVFPDNLNHSLKKYSLNLYKCLNCDLVQFKNTPPLDDMYGKTYGYRTSLSPLMISHIKEKYKYIKSNKIIKKNSYILDIGSNDGTFLNFFAKEKNSYSLFGIDPSAEKFVNYYNKKINLVIDYFSKEKLLSLGSKFFVPTYVS